MADIAARRHHALDYIEIGVVDFDATKAFYGAAFGWTFNDYGPGPAYVGIRGFGPDETVEVGGFYVTDTVRPGGPLVLLYSDDVEASLAAVREAGGEVSEEPFEFPGGRRFHFRDPSGNELGVWSDKLS